MNPIHRCIQKISPGNHFSYVRDVRTDKGDAICPPHPIINDGGIKTYVKTDEQENINNFTLKNFVHLNL